MTAEWLPLPYRDWRATRDTLHAHAQVLGKLSAALAPPEPQLQHAALRLTARGIETLPLPAPNGSGALVVALDLQRHHAIVEHSGGLVAQVSLVPDRAVGEVARELLAAVAELGGPVEINPAPQEVEWSLPLDQDHEHRSYAESWVGAYVAAATRAALVLAAFRAPYRGRSTPVNAWWGSFDLSVSLFSGEPATPPGDGFILRNSGDAKQVEIGWWPGDERYPRAAFYGYAHPAPDGFARAAVEPAAARFEERLGEYVLDWDDVRTAADPHGDAVRFARSVFRHACDVCGWDEALAASAHGSPPPVS